MRHARLPYVVQRPGSCVDYKRRPYAASRRETTEETRAYGLVDLAHPGVNEETLGPFIGQGHHHPTTAHPRLGDGSHSGALFIESFGLGDRKTAFETDFSGKHSKTTILA